MLITTLETAQQKALYRVMYSQSMGCDHAGRTMLREPIEVGSAFRHGDNLVVQFDIDIGRGLCEGRLVLESLMG